MIIVFTFFVRVATISGQSMENTFHDGEKVVVSGFNYKPKQGDVVIVSRNYYNNPNIDPVDSNSQPIIKRVIATENQTIMIKDGNVYVDGEMLDEPYINNYHLGATTDAGHSSLDL
ncbi:MAG: signal peptidase I, partial [Clostridia bacterium]|nr:signal peptidase I [Clostridia bacterium]